MARFSEVCAASHLAAGSFLHSLQRNVSSSSSGLMRRRQNLQGDVRPLFLGVVYLRRDVPIPQFFQNSGRFRMGQAQGVTLL